MLALGSTPRTAKTHGSVAKSLEIALSEFGSALTDDERKQLQQIKAVPDASAALVFTARLDASNSARRGKSIGARVYSMLQSVQQFSTIVDTFMSAHPDIAALVWGSVKITVLVRHPSRLWIMRNSVWAEPSRLQQTSPRTSNPLQTCSWVSTNSSLNSMNISFFFQTRPHFGSQYAFSMPPLFGCASRSSY